MTMCLSGKALRAGAIGLRVLSLVALQASRLAINPTWAPPTTAEPAAPHGALHRGPAASRQPTAPLAARKPAREDEREAVREAIDTLAGPLAEEQLWFSPIETGTSLSRLLLRLTRDFDHSAFYRRFVEALRGHSVRHWSAFKPGGTARPRRPR